MGTSKPPKLPAIFLQNGGTFKPWHCHRCGNPVRPENAVVLEESGSSCEFHDFGMPEGESMGLAVFGRDCAAYLRRRAKLVHIDAQEASEVQQAMLERLEGKHRAVAKGAYGDCLREVLETNLKN